MGVVLGFMFVREFLVDSRTVGVIPAACTIFSLLSILAATRSVCNSCWQHPVIIGVIATLVLIKPAGLISFCISRGERKHFTGGKSEWLRLAPPLKLRRYAVA
jgi:hypothetical protein